MYTQFFGNYLLSRKYVTKEQLLESLWDKDGIFVDENTVAVTDNGPLLLTV